MGVWTRWVIACIIVAWKSLQLTWLYCCNFGICTGSVFHFSTHELHEKFIKLSTSARSRPNGERASHLVQKRTPTKLWIWLLCKDTNHEKNSREQNHGDKTEISPMLKPYLLQQNWALDTIGEAILPTNIPYPVRYFTISELDGLQGGLQGGQNAPLYFYYNLVKTVYSEIIIGTYIVW